ncbi:MAG: F0F1 ATP synthase subunit B [Planctomycetes bacterium]|nr:F0F1 ATP synthase subunit B [Planctomycetota bacterium]
MSTDPAFLASSPLEASPLGIGIWVIVTFVLLFVLLYKTAWPKLLNALEERERSIRQALDEADRSRQEATALVEAHREEIARAREEARAILEEGRVEGQKLRTEIVGQARAEAEQILARSRQEIGLERDRAIEALRREAVDLSLEAAATVLGRAITDADHRRLAEESVSHLGKLTA